MECGHVDPWTCSHDDGTISDAQVDAYRAAALTLLALGYTPAPNIAAMRVLWRRRGFDRDLVQRISEQWQVSA
jgi:hypothetical protein